MRLHALMLVLATAPVSAQVYKCTEGGKTVFSDYPCQRTDNKTINVRPAAGGPVNRSSEYWEDQRRRQEAEDARFKAELEKSMLQERRPSSLSDIDQERRLRERQREAEQEAAQIELRARREREKQFSVIAEIRPRRSISCWKAMFEKSEFGELDALVSRFGGIESIALNTPRIQLSNPLIQLQGIREDIKKIKFSAPCLENMSANALQYADFTLAFYKSYAAGGEPVVEVRNYAAQYLENYRYGKEVYKLPR